MVVGNFTLNNTLSRAYRWTAGTGLVVLPIQAGSVEVYRPVTVSGNGEFIVGEYAPTYVPTAADVGKKITVLVTAGADDRDYGHAESAPTAAT